jgi:hypothetical protein
MPIKTTKSTKSTKSVKPSTITKAAKPTKKVTTKITRVPHTREEAPVRVLSIHKTFEKDSLEKRTVVLFISDGSSVEKVKKIVGEEKILAFLESIPDGMTVRVTAVDGSDLNLIHLQDRGVKILYSHWHNTGIDKNLSPEEIAYEYAKADLGVFREFKVSRSLVELRRAVIARNAMLGFYGDAVRRIRGAARNAGILDEANDAQLKEDLTGLNQLRKLMGYKKEDATENDNPIPWDNRVNKLAREMPECVLFAKIAGFESMGTAAAVVAYTNGIERFPSVQAYWAYCGEGVVDGVAPKRKKGQHINWSPKLRTILFLMVEAIVKKPNNPWNAVYKQYKEEELAVHLEKHPGCKAPLGHSHSRAKRKVAKEILKRYYLAATSQEFIAGHLPKSLK